MSLFTLEAENLTGKARAGILKTSHGLIPTPIFMPVGTQGAVKAMTHEILRELDTKIILGNTYHLYLRPGEEVISHFGGLHDFIKWDRPILTDSGGYQVFSLKELRKITEEGVKFRSHIDGSKHFFSPEKVIDIERCLGSDFVMVLDECIEYPTEFIQARKSMEMTLRWAKRCKEAFDTSNPRYNHEQFILGIGQGSMFPELRKECLLGLTDIGFDAYALGGLSVGEPTETMYEITDFSTDFLPKNQARYLMGVGTPENILECIDRGIDMFDCVLPTRNARNGQLFTTRGKINIRNNKYKFCDEAIDSNLPFSFSKNYSLAYLRHLFISGEILGLILSTVQNIGFYLWLVRTAREKILQGTYRQWKDGFLQLYNNKD